MSSASSPAASGSCWTGSNNELSADPAGIDEETRRHYARLYARPGAIHNGFGGQFAAFATDAIDNRARFGKSGKLPMPILASVETISYGPSMATEMESVATDVRGVVITDAGHWIMEEQPAQAIALIVPFIESAPLPSAGQERRGAVPRLKNFQASNSSVRTR